LREGYEGLISKKELLEKYKISYGALYRWKRKGLIPDEWFIRKTTPTGQETFFPEEKMTERVELILKEKEDVLLDELSRQLTENETRECWLVIRSSLGDKKINLKDITAVAVLCGEKRHDLTDLIRNIQEEKDHE